MWPAGGRFGLRLACAGQLGRIPGGDLGLMPSRARGNTAAASRADRRVRAGLARTQQPARQAWLVRASVLAGAVGGLTSLAYLAALSAGRLLLWPGRTPVLTHWSLLVAAGAVISILLRVLGDPESAGVLINSIHIDGGRQHCYRSDRWCPSPCWASPSAAVSARNRR